MKSMKLFYLCCFFFCFVFCFVFLKCNNKSKHKNLEPNGTSTQLNKLSLCLIPLCKVLWLQHLWWQIKHHIFHLTDVPSFIKKTLMLLKPLRLYIYIKKKEEKQSSLYNMFSCPIRSTNLHQNSVRNIISQGSQTQTSCAHKWQSLTRLKNTHTTL